MVAPAPFIPGQISRISSDAVASPILANGTFGPSMPLPAGMYVIIVSQLTPATPQYYTIRTASPVGQGANAHNDFQIEEKFLETVVVEKSSLSASNWRRTVLAWLVAAALCVQLAICVMLLFKRNEIELQLFTETRIAETERIARDVSAESLAKLREADLILRRQPAANTSGNQPKLSPEELRTVLDGLGLARRIIARMPVVFNYRQPSSTTGQHADDLAAQLGASRPIMLTELSHSQQLLIDRFNEPRASTNPTLSGDKTNSGDKSSAAPAWWENLLILNKQVEHELTVAQACEHILLKLTNEERSEVEKRLADPKNASASGVIDRTEFRIFWLAACLGALGSLLQSLQSLLVYTGNQQFKPSWTLFYILKFIIGAGLAATFCLVTKGGFLDIDVTGNERTGPLYIFAAVSVIVGLFAGEAMEKLKVVASSLFTKNEHKDTISQTRPVASSARVVNVAGAWELTIDGEHLRPRATVFIDEVPYPITTGSESSMVLSGLPPGTFVKGRPSTIVVVNHPPKLAFSDPLVFRP